MELKIELAGILPIGGANNRITVEHICRVCGEFCLRDTQVISAGDRSKICRTCTKQLAKFFDDNRSAIISM